METKLVGVFPGSFIAHILKSDGASVACGSDDVRKPEIVEMNEDLQYCQRIGCKDKQ